MEKRQPFDWTLRIESELETIADMLKYGRSEHILSNKEISTIRLALKKLVDDVQSDERERSK